MEGDDLRVVDVLTTWIGVHDDWINVGVFFLPDPVVIEVVWGRVPARDRKALRAQASAHRVALLEQWETDVCL